MKEDIEILRERMVVNAKKLYEIKTILKEERASAKVNSMEIHRVSIGVVDRLFKAKSKEGMDGETLDFAIQQILESLEKQGISTIDPSNNIDGFFKITGTEKNPKKKEGDFVRITKMGFVYDGEILRPLEKIVVKNS